MSFQDAITAIRDHRDTYYPTWCKERGLLNFVLLLLREVK